MSASLFTLIGGVMVVMSIPLASHILRSKWPIWLKLSASICCIFLAVVGATLASFGALDVWLEYRDIDI